MDDCGLPLVYYFACELIPRPVRDAIFFCSIFGMKLAHVRLKIRKSSNTTLQNCVEDGKIAGTLKNNSHFHPKSERKSRGDDKTFLQRMTSNFFDYFKMFNQGATHNDPAGIQEMKNLIAGTDTTKDEFKIRCTTFRHKPAFYRT